MWTRCYKYGFKCDSVRKDETSVTLAKQYFLSDDDGRETLRELHPDHCDTTFADVETYEFILEENQQLTVTLDKLRFETTQSGRPVEGLRRIGDTLTSNNQRLETLRRQYGLLQKPKPKTLLSEEDMPWRNN